MALVSKMNTINNLNEISKLEPYELLAKMEITKAPVDVFELARHLPIDVDTSLYVDERLSLSGEVFINKQINKPVIWVNPLDAFNRQRFTMAHEIAHLVNDIVPNLNGSEIAFHDNAQNLRRDGRQAPCEFKANEFAAQLLMPVNFVIDEALKIINNYKKENGENEKIPMDNLVARLASVFQVSNQAMKIRLTRIKSSNS
jgi:Zn-dependent peptidase ImmA (M78 family)